MQRGESFVARDDESRRGNPACAVVSVDAGRAHSRQTIGLSVASGLFILLSGELGPRPASAGVGVGVAPTYPALIQVGDTNVPVGLSITNTSTTPESAGTLELSQIRHTPSCGVDTPVPCPAAYADPGVFRIKGPATGMAGTACAGTTFTIGVPDSMTGEVEFVPSSPVILAPVGTGAGEGCTINFFVDVLKLPKDVSNTPGVQTYPLGRVRGDASVNGVMGTGTGSGVTTVVAPTPTATATPTRTPTRTPTPTPTPTATPTMECVCPMSDLIPGTSRAAGDLPPNSQRMSISQRVDCLSEICPCPPGARLPNGLLDNHLVCSHDNPTCDATMGDNACTFTFRLCFNLKSQENRFLCDRQGPVTEVRLTNPPEGLPRTSVDRENVDAFEAALLNLGAKVGGFNRRSMVFNPPLASTVCTDPIRFTVALRQNARTLTLFRRRFRLNYWVYQSTGLFDGDRIFFECNP